MPTLASYHDRDLARQILLCAAERDPGNALHYLGLGDLCFSEGRLPEAKFNYRFAILLAPRDARGYARLGMAYERSGQYRFARTYYRKARFLSPGVTQYGFAIQRVALKCREDVDNEPY
ncbi:Tetratricopeptide repeat-containing protein [Noviherbaspirillum humi]|uniref:Tetratricopeptide repeat-containing protein n=2 Tax=Noviherbaspirillum humi TaxID=1688639 RepID=A0A239IAG9_9BURK|nr:Tetratricopeptide repeat-containing protein [Noviherbaspirillum humi]